MTIGAMLGDTVHSLFRKPATEMYPYERVHEGPEHLRGALVLLPGKCSGCGICAKDCPAEALQVITLDKKAKRFVIRYNVDRCTFCAQCVKSCNYKCLVMAHDKWELAALNKKTLTLYYGSEEDVKTVLGQLAGGSASGPAQT